MYTHYVHICNKIVKLYMLYRYSSVRVVIIIIIHQVHAALFQSKSLSCVLTLKKQEQVCINWWLIIIYYDTGYGDAASACTSCFDILF